MKVGILGAGALGSLLAAYLMRSQAASAVWLLARSERPGSVTVDEWSVPVTVLREPQEPVDLLIVLVKSYDTSAALGWADRAIGPATVLLTLQNGLGNAEMLAERVGPERVLAGTTALGARLVGPGRVQLGGLGETVIAPWIAAGPEQGHSGDWGHSDTGHGHPGAGRVSLAERLLPEVLQLFHNAGLPARGAPAAEPLLWAKLAVNAAINPLTALISVPNGELLRRPFARAFLEAAATEVGAVAKAAGIALPVDPVLLALQVATATAANRSSMLQDLQARRQTEIEAINGAVIARAEALGVPVPVNRMLLEAIRSVGNQGSS